jgi:hypothetical protein
VSLLDLVEGDAPVAGEAACPGCGADPMDDRRADLGAGASRWSERAPSWCRVCLQGKIVATRAAGVCHCSQVEGEHVHQPGGSA